QREHSSRRVPILARQVHCVPKQVAGAADGLWPAEVPMNRKQTQAMRCERTKFHATNPQSKIGAAPQVDDVVCDARVEAEFARIETDYCLGVAPVGDAYHVPHRPWTFDM